MGFSIDINSDKDLHDNNIQGETFKFCSDLLKEVGQYRMGDTLKDKAHIKISRSFDISGVSNGGIGSAWLQNSKVGQIVKRLNEMYPQSGIKAVLAGEGSKATNFSTEQQEIMTGLYILAELNNKPVTLDNLKQLYSVSEIESRESLDKMWELMNKDSTWLKSFEISAKTFKSKFKNPDLKLYYGIKHGILAKIYDKAKELLKRDGYSFNINKWNPADIWLITPNGLNDIDILLQSTTIDEFNIKLQQYTISGHIIPVSLKKTDGKSAKITGVNLKRDNTGKSLFEVTEKDVNDIKFTNIASDVTNLNKSKDMYIKCNIRGLGPISMQCRTFQSDGTNFSVEIKGANANHGKLSIKVVQELLNISAKRNVHFFDDYKKAHVSFGAKYDKVIVKNKVQEQIKSIEWPDYNVTFDFYKKWKSLTYKSKADNIVLENYDSSFARLVADHILEDQTFKGYDEKEFLKFREVIHLMNIDQRVSKFLAINTAYNIAILPDDKHVKKFILDLFRLCSSQHQVSAPFYKIM